MKRFCLVTVLAMMLAPALGAQDQPQGTIWFYRSASDRSTVNMDIYAVGLQPSRIAHLERGEFFGFKVNPGIHAFSFTRVPSREERLTVTVTANAQVFVDASGRQLRAVSLLKGAGDLRGLRAIPDSRDNDPSVIRLDAPVAAADTSTPPVRLPAATDSESKGDVFGGYSFMQQWSGGAAANFTGWDAQLAFNLTRNFALVGDVSGHYGSAFFTSGSILGYRGGPRISAHYGPARFFIQGTAGGATATGSGVGSVSGVSFAAGAGVDLDVGRTVAVRLSQIDYVAHSGSGINAGGMRVSTGFVFRFR